MRNQESEWWATSCRIRATSPGISKLGDNQQFRFAKVSEAILAPALAMRLGELRHQGRRRHELHRIAGQDCLVPDRHCQMRLPDAGGSNNSTTSALTMKRPAAIS